MFCQNCDNVFTYISKFKYAILILSTLGPHYKQSAHTQSTLKHKSSQSTLNPHSSITNTQPTLRQHSANTQFTANIQSKLSPHSSITSTAHTQSSQHHTQSLHSSITITQPTLSPHSIHAQQLQALSPQSSIIGTKPTLKHYKHSIHLLNRQTNNI